MKTPVLVLVSITLMACVHHVASQPKPTCPSTCDISQNRVRGPDGCCCVCKYGYQLNPDNDQCECPEECDKAKNMVRGPDDCTCVCLEGMVYNQKKRRCGIPKPPTVRPTRPAGCPEECDRSKNMVRGPDDCACVCPPRYVLDAKTGRCLMDISTFPKYTEFPNGTKVEGWVCPRKCDKAKNKVRGPDLCACVCMEGMVLDPKTDRCATPIAPKLKPTGCPKECKAHEYKVRGPDGCACVCREGMVTNPKNGFCAFPRGPEVIARVTYPQCKWIDIAHKCTKIAKNTNTFSNICSHTTNPFRKCERTITCERPKAAWEPFNACMAQCWATDHIFKLEWIEEKRLVSENFVANSRFDYELHAYGNDDKCLESWVQKNSTLHEFRGAFTGLKDSYTLDQFKKFTFRFHMHGCSHKN